MAGEVQIQSDQFLRAIREYADGLGKDFAMSVNKKMRDASFKASKAAPMAVKADIDKLNTPKFAAWALSKQPLQRVRVKYRHYTGKLGKNWNKKYRSYYRMVSRHYSRQEAKKWLRAVIGRRKAAVTYVRAFFLNLAKGVEDDTPGLDKRSRHYKSSGFKVKYVPAKAGDPSAYGSVLYEYKHSWKGKIRLDRMLENTWLIGMAQSTAETIAYLREKMSAAARRHSVK